MKIAVLGHSQTRYLNFKKTLEVKKFYKSGANFRSIQESLQFQKLVEFKPDLLFLFLGSNDITEESQVNKIFDNYNELKAEIEEKIKPKRGCYLLDFEKRTLNNKYVSKNTYRKIRNALIKKIKKLDKDNFIPFRPFSGLIETDIGPDGIHINNKGATIIVENIEQKIAQIKDGGR